MRPFWMALLLALMFGVAGCVLPPALTIVSFAADGLSLVSSGKTVTDHAISLLAHKDCRMWRLLEGKSVCGSEATVVAVAQFPVLPLRSASPATRPPEPTAIASAFVEAAAAVVAAAQAAPSPAPVPTVAVSTPAVAHQMNPAAATRQANPTAQVVAPAPPSTRRASGDAPARGEMVIRSGTDEAEARALAADLHAVGATVRPVRHGDVTIYEVVMGLSG